MRENTRVMKTLLAILTVLFLVLPAFGEPTLIRTDSGWEIMNPWTSSGGCDDPFPEPIDPLMGVDPCTITASPDDISRLPRSTSREQAGFDAAVRVTDYCYSVYLSHSEGYQRCVEMNREIYVESLQYEQHP